MWRGIFEPECVAFQGTLSGSIGDLPKTRYLFFFVSFSERRHSSASKPSLAVPPTSVFSFFPSLSKSKGGNASGSSRPASSGVLSASSLSSKLLKSPKEKLQLRGNTRPMHPIQQSRVPQARMWVWQRGPDAYLMQVELCTQSFEGRVAGHLGKGSPRGENSDTCYFFLFIISWAT